MYNSPGEATMAESKHDNPSRHEDPSEATVARKKRQRSVERVAMPRSGGNRGNSPGASSSNTAPANCTDLEKSALLLRTPIDCLSVTDHGNLNEAPYSSLQTPKAPPQSEKPLLSNSPHKLTNGSAHTENAPRTVIRGESFNTHQHVEPGTNSRTPHARHGSPSKAALTDWLNFTFPLKDSPESINTFFRAFIGSVGDVFAPLSETGHGLNGWRRSFTLGDTGARFAIGGQNGKAFLSLSGESCALIHLDAWPAIIHLLRDHYSATITRWDGAVDEYDGEHSVDHAVELYKAGKFNAGGNKASCSQHGNWIDPDGSGRTFEVGKRKNGKMLRIYEKGKQLGDPNSPWVRWELELHSRDRVIPWEVLLNPGGYVAGSYQCMDWVNEEACRIKTTKKTLTISYKELIDSARLGYGRLINVMQEIEGSPENVIKKLSRPGTPSRMIVPIPPEADISKGGE